MNIRFLVPLTLAGAVASLDAGAAVVTEWSLTAAPGNQATQAAASAAAGVTGSDVARGAGLAASAAAGSFSSSGWENVGSGATTDEYFSFGFVAGPGVTVDLDALFIGTRASATGPGTLGLFYSGDGFATSLFTFNQAGTAGGTGFLNSVVDLTGLPSLTGSVEFRIFEIGNTQADGVGATASTGTFRITNYFGPADTGSFRLDGTVAGAGAVPLPAAGWLMLSGLAGLLGFTRRK